MKVVRVTDLLEEKENVSEGECDGDGIGWMRCVRDEESKRRE